MQIKHAEIEIVRQVRNGAPVERLDALLDRAREEFPMPGTLLLAIANSGTVLPTARAAVQEVLETCWNVVEIHELLKIEEDREGRSREDPHLPARRMLDVWVAKLSDALGPRPEEPEEDAQDAGQDEGEEASSITDPTPISVGALRLVLDPEEIELARMIARKTGYLPGIERDSHADGTETIRGVFVATSLTAGDEVRSVSVPRGTPRPLHAALSAIMRYLDTRTEVRDAPAV